VSKRCDGIAVVVTALDLATPASGHPVPFYWPLGKTLARDRRQAHPGCGPHCSDQRRHYALRGRSARRPASLDLRLNASQNRARKDSAGNNGRLRRGSCGEPRPRAGRHYLSMRNAALVAKSYEHYLNNHGFKERCWRLGTCVVSCRGLTLDTPDRLGLRHWTSRDRRFRLGPINRRRRRTCDLVVGLA
jgi:hypothetical protein